jgi:hypothetical protein
LVLERVPFGRETTESPTPQPLVQKSTLTASPSPVYNQGTAICRE